VLKKNPKFRYITAKKREILEGKLICAVWRVRGGGVRGGGWVEAGWGREGWFALR